MTATYTKDETEILIAAVGLAMRNVHEEILKDIAGPRRHKITFSVPIRGLDRLETLDAYLRRSPPTLHVRVDWEGIREA